MAEAGGFGEALDEVEVGRSAATGDDPALQKALEYMGLEPGTKIVDVRIDKAFIGSCTNGRLEDLQVASRILKGKKIHASVRAILSPATPKIFQQALDQGIIKVFMDAGFCVTNPTCGACLGMSNGVLAEGEVCA